MTYTALALFLPRQRDIDFPFFLVVKSCWESDSANPTTLAFFVVQVSAGILGVHRNLESEVPAMLARCPGGSEKFVF